MLTVTTLLYDPSAVASADQVWIESSLPAYAEWLTVNPTTGQTSGAPVNWGNDDVAEYPALGGTLANPTDVAVSDAGSTTLVFASGIIFLSNPTGGASYYDIKTSTPTSNDVLQIPTPPSGSTIGTTIDAQTGTFASIAVGIVSPGMAGGTAGNVQITGTGSLTIAAGAVASVNNLAVGQASGDTGTLDVEGALNVTTGDTLNVSNGTLLAGAGTINLVGNASLTYASTANSAFTGQIIGAGDLEVDPSSAGATGILTVGGRNDYSGGTAVNTSELQLEKNPTLNSLPTLGSGAVTIGGGGTLDLNGCSLTVSALEGSGTALDDSSGTSGSPVGVTILTIDNSSDDTFGGQIDDSFVSGGANAAIRLVKTGPGNLTLSGYSDYSGGTELDSGMITIGGYDVLGGTNTGVEPGAQLDINGGTLNLNGFNAFTLSSLDGNSGFITDNSAGGGTTTLFVGYNNVDGGSHPAVFGGVIENGPNTNVAISLGAEGIMIFTGQNTYTGRTYVGDGWLQIGDGTTNGSLTGPVYLATQNGLTFDVASVSGSSPSETFDGVILSAAYSGSVLKTGDGSLLLTGDTGSFAGQSYTGNTYAGAMRVEDGTVQLGDGTALAAGTQLIVDGGAEIDLDGHATQMLQSVTINNGSVVSTAGGATISATDSFNLANGTIGSGVTLAGAASLNKRTTPAATALTSAGRSLTARGTWRGRVPRTRVL
jgi:autotransporter-associated beta strand protein